MHFAMSNSISPLASGNTALILPTAIVLQKIALFFEQFQSIV